MPLTAEVLQSTFLVTKISDAAVLTAGNFLLTKISIKRIFLLMFYGQQHDLGPRLQVAWYFRKRRFFPPYLKKSASTRIVFESYVRKSEPGT